MPTPPLSHQIRISVLGIDKQPLEGATVVLTLKSETTREITNSKGECMLNTGNLPSGWNVDDSTSITSSKTGEGTKTQTLVLTSAPQKLSMTLEETSNLIYHENTETNEYVLNFIVLNTYDGRKVTHANPLPVKVVDENGVNSNRKLKSFRDYDSSNRLIYQGWALPGTSTSEAKWQIMKRTYLGNKPEEDIYAGGSDAFDKIWNNRIDYNYS